MHSRPTGGTALSSSSVPRRPALEVLGAKVDNLRVQLMRYGCGSWLLDDAEHLERKDLSRDVNSGHCDDAPLMVSRQASAVSPLCRERVSPHSWAMKRGDRSARSTCVFSRRMAQRCRRALTSTSCYRPRRQDACHTQRPATSSGMDARQRVCECSLLASASSSGQCSLLAFAS